MNIKEVCPSTGPSLTSPEMHLYSAYIQAFQAHLSKFLIDDPKLEIVAYHVFVKGDNKSWSL